MWTRGTFFRYRAALPGSVLPAIVVVLIVPSPRDGLASGALRPTSPAEYHRAWIVKRVRRNLSEWVGFSCQPSSLLALMVGVDGELLRLIVGDDR
jgi:hypothetical protein